MKLSEHTLKILKNFSSINQSILITPGNLIRTKSNAGTILAESTIDEDFTCEFAIYDLVEFLNTLKLFESPVLDFSSSDDNFMYIVEEKNPDFRVRYTFANKEHIEYPKAGVVLPSQDFDFVLETKTLESITKASNVMQLPNMMIVPSGSDKLVKIEVTDVKNKSANKFSINVPGSAPSPDKKFKLIFNMDNFKMLPGEYSVTVSGERLISSFESERVDYYLGLDANSRF